MMTSDGGTARAHARNFLKEKLKLNFHHFSVGTHRDAARFITTRCHLFRLLRDSFSGKCRIRAAEWRQLQRQTIIQPFCFPIFMIGKCLATLGASIYFWTKTFRSISRQAVKYRFFSISFLVILGALPENVSRRNRSTSSVMFSYCDFPIIERYDRSISIQDLNSNSYF